MMINTKVTIQHVIEIKVYKVSYSLIYWNFKLTSPKNIYILSNS